jgi:hypothetical protein
MSSGNPLAHQKTVMRRLTTCSVIGVVLLAAAAAGAQPRVDVSTDPAPPQRLETRPPLYDMSPTDGGYAARGPRLSYGPVFIGPTLKSEASEFGFSAWIAPNPPLGVRPPGATDVSGWASIGLTFTWGDPPLRPSSDRPSH